MLHPPVCRIALILALAVVPGARGEEGLGPWVPADEADLRLVSAVAAVGPGMGRLSLGLEVKLAEGWRIYWRTPGAAGLPPQLDWAGSENLAAAVMAWPAPHRFTAFGQESYGYRDHVLFPLTVTAERAGEPVSLRLALSYLVCREVCIPGEGFLSLHLPAGEALPTAAAPAIAASRAALPVPASEAGVTIRAVATPAGLTVTAHGDGPFVAPDVFLEWQGLPGQRRPDLPPPRVSLADGGRQARFDIALHPPLSRPGHLLTVTVTDAGRALEQAVAIEPGP